MSVLRLRRGGHAVLLSLMATACSNGLDSATGPLKLSGSVGDGPVVGATIKVTDADGKLLDEHVSDSAASYRLTLPVQTALPVLVAASGGEDLVTGRPLDFTLLAAALHAGPSTVNVSPLTTLAVRAAQCSTEGLSESTLSRAWQLIHDGLSMGLDPQQMPDPMSTRVTRDTVEAVVLANEALGESVRRAMQALENAGSAVSGDDVLRQIGCHLVGQSADPTGAPVDDRVVATFKAAELSVRLETLAGRLEVDGSSASERLNDAIRQVRPDVPSPAVDRVPANAAARAQTLVLVSLFGDVAASDALMALASDLAQAPLASLPARMNADLTTVLHQDLAALTSNVALADDSEVAAIADRWARQGTEQPPAVSLASDRQQVAPGEHASLSWASSGAEQCVSSWSGPVASEGVADSGALDSSHLFTLTCMGLGGVGSDTATVRVGSTALPQPAPEPTPLPSLTLTAASSTVVAGSSTELRWSSADAGSCVAAGGWSGGRAVSGSEAVGPLNATTRFELTCSGDGGTVTRSVTVEVQAATTAPAPSPTPSPSPSPAPSPSPSPTPDPTTSPTPAPTVSLSAAASVINSGSTVKLTWSSSNAGSCSAGGGWSGSKATSGSQSVGPLTRATTFQLTCSGNGGNALAMISVAVNGTVTLTWQAPTQNVDGTPLTDLAGYKIYYGSSSGTYTDTLSVASGASSRSVTLPSGDYYFAMTAMDADGNESGYSNEVIKSVP